MAQGWVLSWLSPLNISVAVAYYRVEYRRDDEPWRYTDPIPYDTAYLCMILIRFVFWFHLTLIFLFKLTVDKLDTNSRYIFRVWAYSILGVGEVSAMIEVNIEGVYHGCIFVIITDLILIFIQIILPIVLKHIYEQ